METDKQGAGQGSKEESVETITMANKPHHFSSPSGLRKDNNQTLLTSPGPLHMSDLAPAPNPLSHPHKLEPLKQREHGSDGARMPKRKKTKRRRHTEAGEQRGDLEGGDGEPGRIQEQVDPLLEMSTLKEMQARLDPLYSGTTTPATLNADHQSANTLSSDADHIRIRGTGDGEGELQRSAGKDQTETTETDRAREERDEHRETRHRRRRRKKSHRENGPAVDEIVTQQPLATSDEQDRMDTEVVVDGDNNRAGSTLQDGIHSQRDNDVPHYFPPPNEIDDELEVEQQVDRLVEGSSPSTLLHHQHHNHPNQSPDLVYVERPDGRGFDIRRKLSSVVPLDDTTCGGVTMETHVTSEQTALYSHRLVQRISLAAHGLVAGLSLWDCVVCNVLGSLPGSHLTLLQSYHPLSLPGHFLHVFLLTFAILSLLDRLDLAKLGKECWQFTLHSLTGFAILAATVLTGIAFIVSLSIAATDERISLYPDQPSLWPDIVTTLNLTSTNSTPPTIITHTVSQYIVYVPTGNDPTTSRLKLWLGLVVFRSICCVLGWGLLIFVTNHDRMEEYILSMLESSKGQSQLPNGSPNTTTANKTITKPDQTVPTATLSNDLTTTTTTPTTIQPKTLHV